MIFDTEEELHRFLQVREMTTERERESTNIVYCQGGYSPAGPQVDHSTFYGSIGPYGSAHYGHIGFPTGTMSWRGSQANIH